jgi:AcrR family transcriptional regulator
MDTEQGLRERKKEQTRRSIAESARALFQKRGFDAVSVAEIARAADVSEGTVFNYFPTKEELFYGGMEAFEARLVDAVRARPSGQSVLESFRRGVLGDIARLASDDVAAMITDAARIVGSSRALQAREREIVAEYTEKLAALIREDTRARPESVEPLAVATALMGVQRALVAYVHSRILAGERGARLTAGVRREGKRAFDRLERGLGDYAVR